MKVIRSYAELQARLAFQEEEARRWRDIAQTLEDRLQRCERELVSTRARLEGAREADRRRISRELHDSVGQYLTGIRLNLEKLLRDEQLAPCGLQTLAQNLALVQKASEEVRRIAMDQHPAMLDDLGLLATITWFCREYRALYPHIDLGCNLAVIEEQIPAALKITVFRILQEGLHNVAKHSRASAVGVDLAMQPGGLVLSISDNGIGIDPARTPVGLGLPGMRERCALSGADFRLETSRGKGTTIRAVWSGQSPPLERSAEHG